jgi:hypothetical protein
VPLFIQNKTIERLSTSKSEYLLFSSTLSASVISLIYLFHHIRTLISVFCLKLRHLKKGRLYKSITIISNTIISVFVNDVCSNPNYCNRQYRCHHHQKERLVMDLPCRTFERVKQGNRSY